MAKKRRKKAAKKAAKKATKRAKKRVAKKKTGGRIFVEWRRFDKTGWKVLFRHGSTFHLLLRWFLLCWVVFVFRASPQQR